ncbi:hypothetical protein MKW92_005151 [Papaver armeniacum]|nr:hypothetical protein MKW92_005151 [Papaver armeniacum]
MAADDLSEESWRAILSRHRNELKYLLENWGKLEYEDKETPVHDYLYFLDTTIHEDRTKSDAFFDLRILDKLQKSLQQNIDDGERNFTEYQVALIHSLKKICMMLQELSCMLEEGMVSPDDEFGKWIEEQLQKEDKEGYFNYFYGFESQVVKKAKAMAIPINEEKITFKEIRNENPEEVQDRLKVYYDDLKKVDDMSQDNVDCISNGPKMCEYIEEIISELSRRHLLEPVIDIKEERQDGTDGLNPNETEEKSHNQHSTEPGISASLDTTSISFLLKLL